MLEFKKKSLKTVYSLFEAEFYAAFKMGFLLMSGKNTGF